MNNYQIPSSHIKHRQRSSYRRWIILPIGVAIIYMSYCFYNKAHTLSKDSKSEFQEAESAPLTPLAKNNKKFPSIIQPTQLTHAVIVAGHAVLRINKLSTAETSDAAWYLLSYQLNQGYPGIISSHIKKGISIAQNDPGAMLLFSGGQTRRDVGPLSEAASYYFVASEKKWFTTKQSPSNTAASANIVNRVFLEEYARDSFENLLFSVCRFREATGRYPSKVTVIGFDFKSKRFTDFHRKAIAYPSGNFSYVGIQPKHPNFDHGKAARGEADTVRGFKSDMYGCSSQLSEKRDVRNPFRRTTPYLQACPELQKLLAWCGPHLIDQGAVPWNSGDRGG